MRRLKLEKEDNPLKTGRKRVIASNGLIFDSLVSAAEWVRENTSSKKVLSSNITTACKKGKTCGKLFWKYLDNGIMEFKEIFPPAFDLSFKERLEFFCTESIYCADQTSRSVDFLYLNRHKEHLVNRDENILNTLKNLVRCVVNGNIDDDVINNAISILKENGINYDD